MASICFWLNAHSGTSHLFKKKMFPWFKKNICYYFLPNMLTYFSFWLMCLRRILCIYLKENWVYLTDVRWKALALVWGWWMDFVLYSFHTPPKCQTFYWFRVCFPKKGETLCAVISLFPVLAKCPQTSVSGRPNCGGPLRLVNIGRNWWCNVDVIANNWSL